MSVSPAWLKARAGRYSEIGVTFRDGALWLERKNRPTRRLSPLTREGLFEVESSSTLRVRFTAEGLETLRRGDPAPQRFERD